MSQEPAEAPPSACPVHRARLEFLVDGVFAIAMTILVLELRAPELADRRSAVELAKALRAQAPTFFSYVLSFGMLGVLWYRHNQVWRHVRFVTRPMFVLQLVQLAAAASFPFSAAVLGRLPGNPLAPLVYSGCLVLYLWSAFVSWVWAARVGALEIEAGDERRLRRRQLRGAVSLSVLFAAYAIAFFAH